MDFVPYFLQESKRCELMKKFEVQELYLPSEFEDIMNHLENLSECNLFLVLDMCMYFDVHNLHTTILKLIYDHEKDFNPNEEKYILYIQNFMPMFKPIQENETLAEFCCRCNCFFLFYEYCLLDSTYPWNAEEINSCLSINSNDPFLRYLKEFKNKIEHENKEVETK